MSLFAPPRGNLRSFKSKASEKTFLMLYLAMGTFPTTGSHSSHSSILCALCNSVSLNPIGSGIRVSSTGSRFRIRDALVFNLFDEVLDEEGGVPGEGVGARRIPRGQAALFRKENIEYL